MIISTNERKQRSKPNNTQTNKQIQKKKELIFPDFVLVSWEQVSFLDFKSLYQMQIDTYLTNAVNKNVFTST